MGLERARHHLPGLLGHLGYLRQECSRLSLQSRRPFRHAAVSIAASSTLPVDVEQLPPRLASERTSHLLLCNRSCDLRHQHGQLRNRHVAG